jgi:hypothetical protein
MGILALLLLALALLLSAERYVLIPLALLAGFAFIRLPEPVVALAAAVPYLALANLEGIVHPSGHPYPSEVILLAALTVLGFRARLGWRFGGASGWALAYGAWMTIAALAAAGTTDSQAIVRLVRIGFLATALFALGREAARRDRGAIHAIDAALGAAALMAILGLGEAAIGWWRTGGGAPTIGSAVGGPELLALQLTLLAPPALALAALGRDSAFATRILVASTGLALALTCSRAGWAGGFAAILGMGLLACKLTPPAGRKLLWLAVGILGLAGIGAILLVIPGSPLAPYGERIRQLSPASLIAARRADWGAGIETIRAHPLFGQPDAPNAYNLFLGLGATSGVLAPLLFSGLVVAAGRSGLRAVREHRVTAPETIGLFGAILGLLVTGMGEATLGARLTPPAFLFLGLWCGLGDHPHPRERSA